MQEMYSCCLGSIPNRLIITLYSSNGQDACLSSRKQGFDSLIEYEKVNGEFYNGK